MTFDAGQPPVDPVKAFVHTNQGVPDLIHFVPDLVHFDANAVYLGVDALHIGANGGLTHEDHRTERAERQNHSAVEGYVPALPVHLSFLFHLA